MSATLAELVRSRRLFLGLSQEDLARRCDFRVKVIVRLEGGLTKNPHRATLASLARGLDLSLQQLIEAPASKSGA